MRAIWAILCQNTIIDQRSNNISLIEVIEELTVPVPPPELMTEGDGELSMLVDGNLVILWTRSDLNVPEKAQTRSRIISPNGGEAQSGDFEIDLTEIVRARVIGRIAELPPLTQTGEYTIKIETKVDDSEWQEEFELPLWVNVQTDGPSD